MKVICRHGHFAFYPTRAEEVAQFCRYFELELTLNGDYWTFDNLAELPRYSLAGKVFGNLPALETYEGRHAWDVMRENNFVYSLSTGLLLPKASVTFLITPLHNGDSWVSQTPLIQPGSRDATGMQVLSYDGYFSRNFEQLSVSGFSYE